MKVTEKIEAAKMSQADAELVNAAKAIRLRAYAPYSSFQVGAALRLKDGSVHVGGNVENVSFALTICAERNAVASAVLSGAKPGDVVAVAIVAHAEGLTPPCGACRQVLAEFAAPKTRVLLCNLRDDLCEETTLAALLPLPFEQFR